MSDVVLPCTTECEETGEGRTLHHTLCPCLAAKRQVELDEDVLNYIEQAQIIVGDSQRKGAQVLHSMGARLLNSLKGSINAG